MSASSSNLRVWVHWLLWPITDSFSLSSSLPFPFSVSLPLSALFSLTVSVPGPFAVFPSAAVVGGRLGAPLQRQVFLSVAGDLMKHADVVINHPQISMQMYMRYAIVNFFGSVAKRHHILVMHLKQQQAKHNEVVMVKIYTKEDVWNIWYEFLQLFLIFL